MRRTKNQSAKIFTSLTLIFLASSAYAVDQLNTAQVNSCIYQYWSKRLNAGLNDARAAVGQAKTVYLPSVIAQAADSAELVSAPGTYAGTAQLSLNQQLINISQWTLIHSQEMNYESAQRSLEDQLLSLMKTAITTSYSLLTLQGQYKLYQERSERLKKFSDLIKEVIRLRLADRSSLYLIESERAQLDRLLSQTDSQVKNTQIQLNVSMGRPVESPIHLDDTYAPKVNYGKPDFTRVAQNLPNVKTLEYDVKARHDAVTSAKQEYIPSLALQGIYGNTLNSFPLPSENPNSLTVAATLTLPLFDQGSRSVRIEQAESQKNTSLALADAKSLQNVGDLTSLANQLQADTEALGHARDGLDLAAKGYQGVLALFSYGKSSFVAVKDAETDLIAAQIEVKTLEEQTGSEKALFELYAGYHDGKKVTDLRTACGVK